MDAFISGKNFQLWGTDRHGHSGILGRVCNIMGCSEVCTQFSEVHVFDISDVAIGRTDHQNELIHDLQVLWKNQK